MENKTPEQIVKELYPHDGMTDVNWDEQMAARKAWLSRQGEVDEGIKKYKEADEHARNMEAMVDEAYERGSKESYHKWKRDLHRYEEAQQKVYDLTNKLAAKDMEISEFKKQVSGLLYQVEKSNNQLAAKEKEIEEFAEWSVMHYEPMYDVRGFYRWEDDFKGFSTTEILRVFREQQNQKS